MSFVGLCVHALVLFYVKVETFSASFEVVWLLYGSSDPASFSVCYVAVLLAKAWEGLRDLWRFVPLSNPFVFPLQEALCGHSCSLDGPDHLFDLFSLVRCPCLQH
ncbi:hypothetical protein SLA2020_282790 [Shorea laevis]